MSASVPFNFKNKDLSHTYMAHIKENPRDPGLSHDLFIFKVLLQPAKSINGYHFDHRLEVDEGMSAIFLFCRHKRKRSDLF